MSIRPIDMQTIIPKMQEVSKMEHLGQQKGSINQQEIANNIKQNIERNQKTVNKPNENQKTTSDADAKKEGKNKYLKQDNKKNNNKKPNSNRRAPYSKSSIDIKI